jgi:hypothetical protein
LREDRSYITAFRFGKLLKTAGVIVLCLFISMQSLQAQTAAKEYKIKAVFLYNFVQFVDWPLSAFSNANAPFVIGIYGDDPFGGFIDETVSGEKVNGHPIIVQRYHDVKELKNCQILYVNSEDADRVKEYISNMPNHSVLTVSDNRNFIRSGGMIRFFTDNNKIRLQINPEAARAADLLISSKLLRVSEIYDPGKQ